jgi:hypothetical protein
LSPIEIDIPEDGVFISKETTLNLNIFGKNAYSKSGNIYGTAIAGVIVAKRTKWLYKNQFQMEIDVEPVVQFDDGSIQTPMNGSIMTDLDKFRIGTFDTQFIDFIYYPDPSSGVVFIESFGTFPESITEGKSGYSMTTIIINAKAL